MNKHFSNEVLKCCDLYCVVWKADLTLRDSLLSVATCMCHIELYITHMQVKG